MFALFLSSYTPLFALVGLRAIGRSSPVAWISGILIIGGALGTVLFLRTASKKPRGGYELLDVERKDGDVVAYVATYLLPFVTVFTGGWRDIASLVALIGLLGWLYVRSRLIYVNPIFLAMGYHLYRVIPATLGTADDSEAVRWPRYFLADTLDIRAGTSVWAHRVTDDLLLYDGELNSIGPSETEHADPAGERSDAF